RRGLHLLLARRQLLLHRFELLERRRRRGGLELRLHASQRLLVLLLELIELLDLRGVRIDLRSEVVGPIQRLLELLILLRGLHLLLARRQLLLHRFELLERRRRRGGLELRLHASQRLLVLLLELIELLDLGGVGVDLRPEVVGRANRLLELLALRGGLHLLLARRQLLLHGFELLER